MGHGNLVLSVSNIKTLKCITIINGNYSASKQ
ncbi:hypothetical protein PS691_00795 [Pseudomonas fluorescens]|uniref:Uncharacterized protein n=1 Tax=Pseudomonas fluorescens TaxID=294 RepID=A0A5E7ACJ4_PSEFL|nr:hypothetical protein PS691_00795 [Pseudomonas fluorescens]